MRRRNALAQARAIAIVMKRALTALPFMPRCLLKRS
jgi:hypothetical protein